MAKRIGDIVFFTIQEVALILGVTSQTVRAWIKRGKIRGQRIGRGILITEPNLKDFLAPSTGGLNAIREKIKSREANIS